MRQRHQSGVGDSPDGLEGFDGLLAFGLGGGFEVFVAPVTVAIGFALAFLRRRFY